MLDLSFISITDAQGNDVVLPIGDYAISCTVIVTYDSTPPVVPNGNLQIRIAIDSAIGMPMVSRSFPDIVVYGADYATVSQVFPAPVSDADGVITLSLNGDTSLSPGQIVWVGGAGVSGSYGQPGYEVNGILTQCVVESV